MEKLQLFFVVKQVFPDLDLMGWYTTGGAPNDSDLKVGLKDEKIGSLDKTRVM